MRYSVFGNGGAASTTAATAGILVAYNPASATMAAAKMYEWEVGPAANSADETYTVACRRGATAPTVTAVTPSPLDAKAGASVTLAGKVQTADFGTPGVEIGRWGFHYRGGYRWVAIPGGEIVIPLIFGNGIGLNYVFAQGTSVGAGTLMYDE